MMMAAYASSTTIVQPHSPHPNKIKNEKNFISNLIFPRHGDKLVLKIIVRAVWNPALELILTLFQ